MPNCPCAVCLRPRFHSLTCRDHGCNVCGEGGEYETLTLDCPLFTHGSIVLEAWEVVEGPPDPFSPVGHLHPVRFRVQPKAQAGSEQGPHGLSPAEREQPMTLHSPQPQLAQPPSAHPQAEGTDVPGAPHPASTHLPATPAADAGKPGSPHGPQQQQHQQQQQLVASDAESGRIIQVPSQLPRLPQSSATVSQPQLAGSAAQITSKLSLIHSSCGVYAVCRSRVLQPCEGEDAAASAAMCGQALSHALQTISIGEENPLVLYPSAHACCSPPFGSSALLELSLPAFTECVDKHSQKQSQPELHVELHASAGLQTHSMDLSNAVFVHLYLRSMSHFPAANAAFARHFPAVNPPARACVEALLPPGCPVAVDVLCRPAGVCSQTTVSGHVPVSCAGLSWPLQASHWVIQLLQQSWFLVSLQACKSAHSSS